MNWHRSINPKPRVYYVPNSTCIYSTFLFVLVRIYMILPSMKRTDRYPSWRESFERNNPKLIIQFLQLIWIIMNEDKIIRKKNILTWESLRPSFSASFLRSGLLMYFCIWNLFSRPRLWRSEKTALLIIPLRGFPRAFVAQGKTNPVPAKSPRPPWMALGNAAPPPGAAGWWVPVPEFATGEK